MTPAVDMMEKAGIPFTLHEYDHDTKVRAYGQEAARKLGIGPDRIFKTLVVSTDNKGLAVGVVPVSGQLDLKGLAKALGKKKTAMAEKKQMERSTGYLAGGISPLGQKKQLPTIIDVSALAYDTIFVSAGRRGLQICLSPRDLARLTQAIFYGISKF
ncbi:MAG: Cys-tRNA(Pro) deacylase [Proteobacteria bacterium]|nr:Cys-tRNA(Pro) deacylase [Desulfobacula sp.]MBU4130407.1 Cys-tRNA(Pro) deacylase [Pseudomonadota bacterium]